MNAIGIKIKKADEKHDCGASKFFGAPAIPAEWQERFSEDVIFFGQIRLSDIAELDTENKLPHTGYLYLFLDVEMYPYQAMAYYYDGEPNVVVDDFNEAEVQFAHLNEDWLMSFEPADEDFDGTRLFGVPPPAMKRTRNCCCNLIRWLKARVFSTISTATPISSSVRAKTALTASALALTVHKGAVYGTVFYKRQQDSVAKRSVSRSDRKTRRGRSRHGVPCPCDRAGVCAEVVSQNRPAESPPILSES